MKILIVDDEEAARKRLRSLLTEIDPAIGVVGEAGDGREALRLIAETEPDVVLMDVCMPRLDGVHAATEIVRLARPPAVIFTTAFDEYAMDAFDVSVVGYLLKPIRKERLAAALEKARRFAEMTASAGNDLPEAAADKTRGHLCSYSHSQLRLIPVRSVVYFRAESKYTVVRTEEAESLIDESLLALEQEFGEKFIRIHRNALVARDRIEGLAKLPAGKLCLRLRGVPETPEVSRRHLPTVRAWLKQRGEGRGGN